MRETCIFVTVYFITFLSARVDSQKEVDKHTNGSDKEEASELRSGSCDKSTSCVHVNATAIEHRNLRRHNCMCDVKCSVYGDCCYDAGYANMKTDYRCVSIANGLHVYMKTTCSWSWQGSKTLRKYCEKGDDDAVKSPPLVAAATDPISRVTYRNLFCALCNYATNFDVWHLDLQYPATSVVSNTTSGADDETTASAKIIAVEPTPPNERVVGALRYCVPHIVDTCRSSSSLPTATVNCPPYASYVKVADGPPYKNVDCLRCNVNSVRPPAVECATAGGDQPTRTPPHHHETLGLEEFTAVDQYCAEIPPKTVAFNALCGGLPTPRPADECATPADRCEIMETYRIGEGVTLLDNATVYVHGSRRTLTNLADGVGSPEWVYVNETFVFVCGLRRPHYGLVRQIDEWMSDALMALSMVGLCLHLAVFASLPPLRNTPGKSMAAYCCSLLVAFLCLAVDERLNVCPQAAVVLHYALLNCFVWMLLMSYNCWLDMHRALRQLRTVRECGSTKFLAYCVLAHAVSALLVGVALFFEWAPAAVIACEWKPRYGGRGVCFISQTPAFFSLFIVPSAVLFVVNNCLFVRTACMIHGSRLHSAAASTIYERYDFKLYLRLALMMGTTWIFGTLYTLTDSTIVQMAFTALNMSQGIFIFVAFTLKKKNLKMLRTKYRRHKRIAAVLGRFVDESTTVTDETSVCLSTRRNEGDAIRPDGGE